MPATSAGMTPETWFDFIGMLSSRGGITISLKCARIDPIPVATALLMKLAAGFPILANPFALSPNTFGEPLSSSSRSVEVPYN